MKKWIHGSDQKNLSSSIDFIIIVNDARCQSASNLPIMASSNDSEDYDHYSLEELQQLDDTELRDIETFYALDLMQTAINEGLLNYKLTKKQRDRLSNYYKSRELAEVQLNEEDVSFILNEVKRCNTIIGPQYRPGQPEKNFAKVHKFQMTDEDYEAIIKDIKLNEYIGTVKSASKERLGKLLYEFIHDPNGYELKYSHQVIKDDIKIYIKLFLDYKNEYNIAIVSFHDPLD